MNNEAQRRLLVVELNEFNVEMLAEACQRWNLPNIQRLFSMRQITTRTDDTYDSNFLEPWTQWTSVHTGVPSSIHKVQHLGDLPDPRFRQIWEVLGDQGIRCGIWGAMNASRGKNPNCLFFLPDPWTFSEFAYPEQVNLLLALPRYVSKNYLNLKATKLFTGFVKLLRYLATAGVTLEILKALPKLIKDLIQFRAKPFVFIAFIEYVLVLLFLQNWKKFQTDFNSVFLNTIAHIQHHHWIQPNLQGNSKIECGLSWVNMSLGHLLANLKPSDSLIVMNALSQMNTAHEPPWILYRQIDQSDFLNAIGVRFSKVEPLMAYDAHVLFDSAEDCVAALTRLKSCQVLGEPLFLVENYPGDPCRLFYRISYYLEATHETVFEVEGKPYRFFDLFEKIVRRTARHVPTATVFTNIEKFPDRIYNHQVYHQIVHFFAKTQAN